MQNAVVLEDVSKSYGKTEALVKVDLQVQKGAFFALLGPNGAGKTTMVKIMTTLAKQTEGSVDICGHDPFTDWRQVQRMIGVVLQENTLDPEVRVKDQLVFQGQLFGLSRDAAKTRSDELLDGFGLMTEAGKKAKTLSGGNRRRLDCALAMVHSPKLLFLDEPTTGMDPHARKVFWANIKRLNTKEGMTIFLTTQYLEEAERHASTMAVVVDGALRYQGSVAAFKKQVHPEKEQSLEEGYIKFVDSIRRVSGREQSKQTKRIKKTRQIKETKGELK